MRPFSASAHMRPQWSPLLAVILLLTAFALPASAAETIRSFISNIQLLKDGTVHVTETITVGAEGNKIKRGIYRDIPTVLINPDGSQLHSNLDVKSVLKNGQPEPFFIEGIQNGTRIYIGDKNTFLNAGIYKYTIDYTMTRMARFFPDHDELYWNATGNFWDFPIEAATARVVLPDGAKISTTRGYTGKSGSLQQAVDIIRESATTTLFRATHPLAAYEGMSVAVSFQKGLLIEPDAAQRGINWLSDHRDIVFPAFAVFLVLLYYLFSWDAVGRDPKKGTIIPLFYPPKGFSPPLAHYVWAMGWKNTGWPAFTSGIVDLAVKGLIRIEKEGKKTRMTFVSDAGRDELPPGESVIFSHINSKGSILIDKNTGPALATKKAEFTAMLEAENRHVYYKNNTLYVVLGIALSIACLGAMAATGVLAFEWLIGSVFVGIFLLVLGGTLGAAGGSGGARLFRFAVIGFIAINLLATLGQFASFSSFSINTAGLAAISIIGINIIFAMLMRAPTIQGRKVMDQIDGFRMYLETAEKNRLNFSGEPAMSVSRFETILPFAIALGVEKPWADRFQNDLSRNAIAGTQGTYQPIWYADSNFSVSNLGRDVSALATGMSAAMIAAQPAQSSSSGFSGSGGGSGGGGGGGGGGGW